MLMLRFRGYRLLLLMLLLNVLGLAALLGPPLMRPLMVPRAGQAPHFPLFGVLNPFLTLPRLTGKGLLMVPRSGRGPLPGSPSPETPELPYRPPYHSFRPCRIFPGH